MWQCFRGLHEQYSALAQQALWAFAEERYQDLCDWEREDRDVVEGRRRRDRQRLLRAARQRLEDQAVMQRRAFHGASWLEFRCDMVLLFNWMVHEVALTEWYMRLEVSVLWRSSAPPNAPGLWQSWQLGERGGGTTGRLTGILTQPLRQPPPPRASGPKRTGVEGGVPPIFPRWPSLIPLSKSPSKNGFVEHSPQKFRVGVSGCTYVFAF